MAITSAGTKCNCVEQPTHTHTHTHTHKCVLKSYRIPSGAFWKILKLRIMRQKYFINSSINKKQISIHHTVNRKAKISYATQQIKIEHYENI